MIMSGSKSAEPVQKLIKRRVLVWSGDSSSPASYTNVTVQLTQPLQQVVYAEWVSCSIPGYCFQVGQFPNSGQTSRHNGSSQYWRFVGSSTNATDLQDFSENLKWCPTNIYNLSMNVFNPDGSTPTLTDHWMLEIDFWCVLD